MTNTTEINKEINQEQIVDNSITEAEVMLQKYSDIVNSYFQTINDVFPYDALAIGTFAFNTLGDKGRKLDWASIQEQFKLIESEVQEVQEAINDKDDMQVISECVDVLVTTYGLLQKYNPYVVSTVIDRIIKGNADKFTKSHQVALDSVEDYAKKGVEVFVKQVGNMYLLKDTNDKIRKPLDWTKPDFEDLRETLEADLAERGL